MYSGLGYCFYQLLYAALLPCGTVWPEVNSLPNSMNRKNGAFLSSAPLHAVESKMLRPPEEGESSAHFTRFSPTLLVHGQ